MKPNLGSRRNELKKIINAFENELPNDFKFKKSTSFNNEEIEFIKHSKNSLYYKIMENRTRDNFNLLNKIIVHYSKEGLNQKLKYKSSKIIYGYGEKHFLKTQNYFLSL